MNAMTVATKFLTYPHQLDEPPRFTTSPVKNMHPSIQTPVMPCSRGIQELPCRLVWRHLTFISSKDDDDDTTIDETPSSPSTAPVQHHANTFQQLPSKCSLYTYVTLESEEEDIEEDFQTVPLDDKLWGMEEPPDRTLCVHEHALLHGLCPYPCPYVNYQTSSYYNTLDISDISEFEDIMTTSSSEDISPLKDIGY